MNVCCLVDECGAQAVFPRRLTRVHVNQRVRVIGRPDVVIRSSPETIRRIAVEQNPSLRLQSDNNGTDVTTRRVPRKVLLRVVDILLTPLVGLMRSLAAVIT